MQNQFNKTEKNMRISAIQPNYFNRISFKADENKQENKENQNFISRMDKNEKIAAGVVSAAVVLAGLGYMGYKGKLGKGIQKMLGGAEDAAKNIKEQNINPTTKTPDVSDSAPNKIEPPIKETAAPSPEVKPETVTAPVKAEEAVETGAKETDTLINIADHKFMTIDEFKKLPHEESLKRAAQDIEIIDTNSSDFSDFGIKTIEYLEKLGIDTENVKKEQADIMDVFFERVNLNYAESLKAGGDYNEIRVAFADIKLLKGDSNAAEKLIMDVINESPIGEDRIEAYKRLHTIEQLQGKSYLLDNAVLKDVQKFNRVHENVNNLYDSLAKKYGDGMTELSEKDDKLLKEALPPFFKYVNYFKNMVEELEPVYGSKCESLSTVKNLNDVLSRSPFIQMITEL